MKIFFTIVACDRDINLEFKPPKDQREQAEGMNFSGAKLVVDTSVPGWETRTGFKKVALNAADMLREAAEAPKEEEEEA